MYIKPCVTMLEGLKNIAFVLVVLVKEAANTADLFLDAIERNIR